LGGEPERGYIFTALFPQFLSPDQLPPPLLTLSATYLVFDGFFVFVRKICRPFSMANTGELCQHIEQILWRLIFSRRGIAGI
ncbi:MAG: hypothetical protein ACI9OI_002464, partial [Chitinophagales bacterium]